MNTKTLAYVRPEMIAPAPAPLSTRSASGWIRINLLATPKDAALTILAVALLVWILPGMINWLFVQAAWFGTASRARNSRHRPRNSS